MMKSRISTSATRRVTVCPTVLLFQEVTQSPKFHQPWQGPYEVEKQMSDAVYGIRKKTLELSNLLFIITDLSHNFNQ